MAGENNNPPATPGGNDRGLNGVQPTVAEQISSFRGASFEDGTIKGAQDGVTPIEDPDNNADGEASGDTPPRVGGDEPAPKVLVPAPNAPKAKSAQDRINEAVKKQRSAERELQAERQRNADFAARLERIEKGLPPAAPATGLTKTTPGAKTASDASAPDPTKYQYGDLDPRYLADLARHEAKTLIEADKNERETARRTAAQQQEAAAFEAAKTKLVSEGVAQFPDFQETVMDAAVAGEWDLTKTVGDLAFDSEQGPAIMYHLATNADESKALAKLPVAKQAAWFGKMEAFFAAKSPPKSNGATDAKGGNSATPPAKMTQAPPVPERRVRGNGNPNPVSPDTTDFAAFERLAKQATH